MGDCDVDPECSLLQVDAQVWSLPLGVGDSLLHFHFRSHLAEEVSQSSDDHVVPDRNCVPAKKLAGVKVAVAGIVGGS